MTLPSDPAAIVQRQLDAFNARDLDALLATYAEDARMFEYPTTVLPSGAAALRERFTARFQEGNLHAALLSRTVLGRMVVDYEEVSRTFPDGPGKIRLLMIYEVQNGKISSAWSIAGEKTIDPSPNMPSSVIALPFNHFIGIKPADAPNQILRLPAGGQYLNHLGTVHASAQLALAEASSGEFLLRALGSTDGVVPVVRRFEAKFRKPANGTVASTVTTPVETLDQLRADLAAKRRALITVAVELHDESGAHTLSASVEWFITQISTPPDAA
jgi:acyl-coenzyme A thioesterase PaaI-like protein